MDARPDAVDMPGTIRLAILDRDGVINFDSDDYVKGPDEWHAIPGSLDAIAALTQAGIAVAVATNQAGLAHGFFDIAALDAMHDKMRGAVAAAGGDIAAIAFCPHGPDARCRCRKPQPGLLLELMQRLDADPSTTVFIGDKPSDVGAARAAGVRPILVRSGYGSRTAARSDMQDVPTFADLAEAVRALLDGTGH